MVNELVRFSASPMYTKWVRTLVPSGARRKIRTTMLEAFAGRDLRNLGQRLPWMRQFSELSRSAEQELRPYYEDYIQNVSQAEVAISWKLALVLNVFCRSMKPKKILDLGSGFSSMVLRLYQQNHAPECSVDSVDDSPRWLDATRSVLRSHGLPEDGLTLWSEFIGRRQGGFDFVLYDLGDDSTRREMLPMALSLVADGGCIVIDDAQWMDYQALIRKAAGSKFGIYSLRSITLSDSWGRYSLLLLR